MHIMLMGMRGSGKSTVGPLLARAMSLAFVDLDERTARTLHARSATEAWRAHGEGTFRAAEAVALGSVLAGEPSVVALGGGTPMHATAHAMLTTAQETGVVRLVYLRAGPRTLMARLRSDERTSERPSLTGTGVVEEVPQVLESRQRTYITLARAIVCVDGRSPHEVCDEVCAGLRRA